MPLTEPHPRHRHARRRKPAVNAEIGIGLLEMKDGKSLFGDGIRTDASGVATLDPAADYLGGDEPGCARPAEPTWTGQEQRRRFANCRVSRWPFCAYYRCTGGAPVGTWWLGAACDTV